MVDGRFVVQVWILAAVFIVLGWMPRLVDALSALSGFGDGMIMSSFMVVVVHVFWGRDLRPGFFAGSVVAGTLVYAFIEKVLVS